MVYICFYKKIDIKISVSNNRSLSIVGKADAKAHLQWIQSSLVVLGLVIVGIANNDYFVL
jgi:hypothetical protein